MQNYLNLSIESENIKLTPIDLSNILDILRGNTGNVKEFFIPFESEIEVEKWINEQQEKMKIGEKIELSIIDIHSNEFIGMVSLDNLIEDKKVEPRIWIIPKYQNKGYGKKSLKLLIDWYKSQPKSQIIYYIADSHNEVSKKLALSLGFVFNKEYTDEYGDVVVEYIL